MSFIYSIFSWLYNTIASYLPFRLAANPSEKVVREQIQHQAIAQNNQSLQDLIVDIISHLPSVEEILHHNNDEVNEENITTSIHELIPQLFDKTFKEAIDFCKNNDQILLVYLHSPGHDDSYDFIQNIFCKREFIEFLNTNFVVFSSSIKSSEGYSISNQLQATSYPFLAVLLGNQVHWRMDGLTELKNLTEMSNGQTHIIDNLMTQLIEVHERLDSQLVIQRQEKLQREYERRAREEQDRAYEESLRIDKEKEEKRLQIEREKQAKVDAFLQKLRTNEIKRSDIRNNIVFYNNEAEYKNIKLKLPNGTETQRKFSLNLTFGDLHRFIHAYPSTEWQPSKYSQVETDYELTLNSFPKRPIPFDDSQPLSSIDGKALFIFVREAEHDEDEQFAAEHSLQNQ